MKTILKILGGILFVFCSLIMVLLASETRFDGTVLETWGKALFLDGRIHADRVDLKITVNGRVFSGYQSFRSTYAGMERFLIYLPSETEPQSYVVLILSPAENMVGVAASTPKNAVLLIGSRILLQSNVATAVLPLEYSDKSGMQAPDFKQHGVGEYSFSALPCCGENTADLLKRLKAGSLNAHSWKNHSWKHLPFGHWEIEYLSG
ncbi:hypothetical protein F9L33_14540 [Amylibacter sp. SFDW26]|uniref:hypothetical protein n=1 Tax=Amylibacter sp. SFDW26 TaxID=2652722 RepID=UPI0012629B3D|nr:hypothetical protein [Amylibacter sp. SFDW26]KAB7610514.1 hypothetical protein F9L33_14540 [Amylibacter sp. SFDW26]